MVKGEVANLSSRTVMTVPESVVFAELASEIVLLDLDGGEYFGLNEVASRMFSLLVKGRQVREVLEVLAAEYDADDETLLKGIYGLIEQLVQKGLVKASNPVNGLSAN